MRDLLSWLWNIGHSHKDLGEEDCGRTDSSQANPTKPRGSTPGDNLANEAWRLIYQGRILSIVILNVPSLSSRDRLHDNGLELWTTI